MNQLTTVVVQCVASGAVFTSLCAAVVVPPLAWLAVRALTPTVTAMSDDPRWQSASATIAAVIPGGLFLALVVIGITDGAGSTCLQLAAGKVLYGVLLALNLGAIARAAVRAYRRERELRWMLGAASPATGRAAAIAFEVDVPLFEVADQRENLIAVAGSPQPGVYVSTRALQQFDDAELRAALYHERAHLERGDHRIAPWLYFITELLPLPVEKLIDVYRCSREFCADRCALVHVDRTDLASALLRVARGSSAMPATSAAFAEGDAMVGRLEALLRPKGDVQPNLLRRGFIGVVLASLLVFGLALPTVATFLFHCNLLRLVA